MVAANLLVTCGEVVGAVTDRNETKRVFTAASVSGSTGTACSNASMITASLSRP